MRPREWKPKPATVSASILPAGLTAVLMNGNCLLPQFIGEIRESSVRRRGKGDVH